MIIRTLIGLKILKMAFIGGIATAYAIQKCCNKKNKDKTVTQTKS
ncbi:hypothetical protein HIMB114_00000080 [alpha proteobacterium HIMB114]|nr:hypothetical protein HIMB114_00000080 [alpha proteobacterium HIMB114]